jgi:hypothetical protein
MKLFLDDVRNPTDCVKYMHARIGKDNPIYLEGEWYVVRNYDEFVKAIDEFYPQITHISFDHDLADEHYSTTMYTSIDEYYNAIEGSEKTGLDCAKYMKKFYDEAGLTYPIMYVHSMNPVGTQAIVNLFRYG